MSRRLLVAVAVAALTLGLASCGDGGEGTVTTPPPTIGISQSDDGGAGPSDGGGAGPSDSEGAGEGEDSPAAAPDIPAPDPADYPGMDQETPEGAEQAVRFYFATLFWGYQVGKTDPLDGLYSHSCETCQGFRERVESQSEGEFWSPFEVVDVGITHVESDSYDLEVGYIFTVGPHTEPSQDGGPPVDFEAINYTAVLGVDWSEDRWVIGAMLFDESSNG